MQFRWTCLAIATALAGCGTEEDDRPLTVEAVTLTVLAPNCGQSQCHSTATRTQGYAFDTVHDSVDALQELVYPPQPLQSELWGVIIAQDYSRMPPDVPLATEDIAYIRRWLVAGAPGL
jgi:hypothetical protein